MSSYSMEHKQQAVSAGSLCYAAVLTALVFVLTFVPKIPIPLGYAHLGDAIIFASVLFSISHRKILLFFKMNLWKIQKIDLWKRGKAFFSAG